MDVEGFIQAIKNRPPIWMSTHPQYKHKKINKKLWEEIKELFPDHEVQDLRKRWKNLKDTFRKEFKKYPKYRSWNANIQSNWRFFQPMSFFIEEFAHNQEPSTSEVQEAVTTETASDNDTKDHLEVPLPIMETKTEPTPKPESPCPSEDSPPAGPSGSGVLRKRNVAAKELRHKYLEIEKKKLKLLERELERSESDREKRSDNYHFLMSILPDIDKLPPIPKMRLRNKINEAVLEELNILHVEKQSDNAAINGEQLNTVKNEYCETFYFDE